MKEKILIVDDERLVRWSLEKELSSQGYTALLAETGEAAIVKAAEEFPDLVLLDLKLPDIDGMEVLKRLREEDKHISVVVITAYGSIDTAVQAIRLGAYDYIVKPFDLEALLLSVRKALDATRLKKEVNYFRTKETLRFNLHRIVGQSSAIQEIRQQIKQIAQSEASTVLLEGESGTGKDLVAHVIHTESSRTHQPFIEVNCAALPEMLIESEVFGHERGAFTDAKTWKAGLLDLANHGTIYLDEIGDMNPALQSKLLGAIENKRFRRLGGVKDISVDVRFIAATNRNLAAAVGKGDFRQDLYYRLKVFPITLPPLRERMSDLPLLVEFLVGELRKDFKKRVQRVSSEAMAFLSKYHWPGNVRELKNVLERAFILCEGEQVKLEHLPPELISSSPPQEGKPPFALPPEGVHLETVEKELIRQALERSGGNQIQAAKLLGISRDVLRYRMKKFDS